MTSTWCARLFGLLLISLVGTAQAAIPAGERQVLVNLYNSTNGANWTNKTGWNGAAGTECSWFGVLCDGGATHVIQVSLAANNLTGTLPALGGLPSLQSFLVNSNAITGSIPTLTGLPLLTYFSVRGNQMTGTIPALTGLTSLVDFYVYQNQLTGSLPSLAGLTALKHFSASSNQLTGTLPALTGLTALQYFQAGANQISGTIPAISGNTALQNFDVTRNALTGPIPSLTGLTSLVYFAASENALTGTIPSLAGLAALQEFYVSQNQLTGSIPSLAGLTALKIIYVWGNQLSGSLPSLAGLTSLQKFLASTNALTGTIPALSGLTALQYFSVFNNSLTGPLPTLTGLSALQTFYANQNQLSGPIPALSGLTALKEFYVWGNQLSGALPTLSGLGALQKFAASTNALSGSIPSLTGLTSLSYFAVNGNALTGTIPTLAGLTALQEFYVYQNQLTGTIPSLSGLAALRVIYVWGNQLTGSLPALDGLTTLEKFDAGSNSLTGSITALGGLTSLQYFSVSGNALTGSMPALTGLGALQSFYIHNNQITGNVAAVPNPNALLAANAKLCPNQLNHTNDAAWDLATGSTPWWQNCKFNQTITFNALSNRVLEAGAFAVSATSTSLLTVAFSSQTPATCGVAGTSVTPLAVGQCTVRASQDGDANYAPAPTVDRSFQIAANQAPSVSAAPALATLEDTPSATIAVTLGDNETPAAGLILTRSSNNPALLPLAGMVLGGSGANRTLTVYPGANANGSGTITLTVTDGEGAQTQTPINVTVTAVNDPPTVTLGANQSYSAGNTGVKNVVGFASNISAGPANEAGQGVSFVVSELSDASNVLTGANLDAAGNLSYTLTGAFGTATLQVVPKDNGGTANGGVDTGAARSFAVIVNKTYLSLTIAPIGARPGPDGVAAVSSYLVRVTNEGSVPALGYRLRVGAPDGLLGVTWTCSVPVGACSPPGGANAVDTVFDLAGGASADVTLSGTIDTTQAFVEINAQLVAPPGEPPDVLGNNQAVYIAPAGEDGVFKASFE